jgi:hypothetical protein
MPARPPAEPGIAAYLDAVAAGLVGPRACRRAILDELRDGLHEAAATYHRHGVPATEAVSAALHEFGSPAALASGFAGELAVVRARRTTLAYLTTGPLIGLSWLAVIVSTRWWQRDPITLLHAIPVLPLIAVAAITGILVLAATGPIGNRLRAPERHGLTGALVIIAAASLADVIMLATAAHLVQTAAQTVIAVAITASTARLTAGTTAMTHCLRSHRTLTSARQPPPSRS